MSTTSKIVVAYVRVSTEKQLDGAGPDQQSTAIRIWALTKGVTIDKVVVDAAGGDTEDRPEILLLKEMAVAGKLKSIIVDRLDRLARALSVHEALYQFFTSHGVKIECVSQQLEDTKEGTAMRQMMAVFAQLDKSNRVQHLKACRRATVARKGTSSGGTAPYGYEVVSGTGTFVVAAGEAKLVKRVFELRDMGLNLSETARQLNAENYRTRVGTYLTPVQVSRLLRRESVYRCLEPVNRVKLDAGVVPAQPAVLTK